MFDDQPIKSNNPPNNLPSEPVDIFAGVEKESSPTPLSEKQPDALDAGLLKKKVSSVPKAPAQTTVKSPEQEKSSSDEKVAEQPPMYDMKEPVLGKIILFILLAVVLGGLGFGSFWLYASISNNKTDNSLKTTVENNVVPEKKNTVKEAVEPVEDRSSVTAEMNNDSILFGEPVDTDKDGLDDVREKDIGTDPNVADTDKDGLSDGDEVIIWKTDPFNNDSDGDGYLDGDEVRNGYNPLGDGKLFSVPTGASSTTTNKNTATNTIN